MRPSPRFLPLILGILIAYPGCGGGDTIWVTGKLLKGGTRYEPPKDQLLTVTFVALEQKDSGGKTIQGGDAYQADYDPDSGTFTVPGPERRGILPGKYRVAVTQKLKREALEAIREKETDRAKKKALTRETDLLGDRFGMITSPFVVEVDGSREVIIDLDRPPPTTDAKARP